MSFLNGQVILEERDSKINGKLTVIRDLFYGTYIMGGGLPQSGGLAEKIWKSTLHKVKASKLEIKSCLILGLGGGGIARIVRKNWPESKITGIDLDPVMVELGKKYLDLESQGVETVIKDIDKFKTTKKYDLVCIDTYIGDKFPKKFESEKFTKRVKNMLPKNGLAIFNRLYGPEDRKEAHNMEKTLEKVFTSVERNFPEANIMFTCSV